MVKVVVDVVTYLTRQGEEVRWCRRHIWDLLEWIDGKGEKLEKLMQQVGYGL